MSASTHILDYHHDMVQANSPPLPTTTNFRSFPLLEPAEPGGIVLASIGSDTVI
jgi:hypothetical protein